MARQAVASPGRSLLFMTLAVASAAVDFGATQEQIPPGQVFRGPLYTNRVATPIAPERGLPLEFVSASISLGRPAGLPALDRARLETQVRSKTVRTIPVAGITLRVAVGPAGHGMFTFRMRPDVPRDDPDAARYIPPDSVSRPLAFAVVFEDSAPALLLLNSLTRIVFTVERIASDEGQAVFDNPDATELLWEALGRPTSTPTRTPFRR